VSEPVWTVGQLREFLRELPTDLPMVADYDCRCAQGGVIGAEIGKGSDDGCEAVVLVIE
jgi:hypothetical protein